MTPALLLSALSLASQPDLVFQSITAEHHPARGEVSLQVVVENTGDARSSETALDVLSAANWERCEAMVWETALETGLAPGEQATLNITIPAQQLMGSPAHLFLDLSNSLSESNERNNEGVIYLMPASTTQPERAADWIWWQHSDCLQETARQRRSTEIGLSRKVFYSRIRLL